jgi:hypothetical protein
VQVGLQDRNTGSFYFVDDVAASTLAPYVGLPVLVEGWVDGPQRINVQFYRVLADDPAPKGGR